MTFFGSQFAVRRWRRVRHAALAVAALAVSHEAVYLVRHREPIDAAAAMSAAGHDGYWAAFLLAAAVSALALLAWSGWRLTIGARRQAELVPGPSHQTSFASEWRTLFTRLAFTVASLFLVQENIEHLLAHGHVEALAVYFGAGAELSLPVVLGVTAVLATLGALVRWQELQIVTRLRAVRSVARWRRPVSVPTAIAWLIAAVLIKTDEILARLDLGRAPPHWLPR